jgi:diketogulonate reductase-like aldo/keto reductase
MIRKKQTQLKLEKFGIKGLASRRHSFSPQTRELEKIKDLIELDRPVMTEVSEQEWSKKMRILLSFDVGRQIGFILVPEEKERIKSILKKEDLTLSEKLKRIKEIIRDAAEEPRCDM